MRAEITLQDIIAQARKGGEHAACIHPLFEAFLLIHFKLQDLDLPDILEGEVILIAVGCQGGSIHQPFGETEGQAACAPIGQVQERIEVLRQPPVVDCKPKKLAAHLPGADYLE